MESNVPTINTHRASDNFREDIYREAGIHGDGDDRARTKPCGGVWLAQNELVAVTVSYSSLAPVRLTAYRTPTPSSG